MMWMNSNAEADDERTYGFFDAAHHLASECSSSSDSESTVDGGALRSSPAQSSSPLASPSSSSSSPPRPHPLSKGTLSEFLAWQLQQPVVNSLKTWLQGEGTEEAEPTARHPAVVEERSGLWSWCLGGDESFWGLDGYSEEEEEEKVVEGERWFLRSRDAPPRGSEVSFRLRKGGLPVVKDAAGGSRFEPALDRKVSKELLLLQEHRRRVGVGGGGHGRAENGRGGLLYRTASDPLGSKLRLPGPSGGQEFTGRAGTRSAPPTPTGRNSLEVEAASKDKGGCPDDKGASPKNLQMGTETVQRQGLCEVSQKAEVKKGVKGKLASFFERLSSTLWMVGGFWMLGYMGHLWMWGLVLVLQVMMVQELFALARQHLKLPGAACFPRVLGWHFVVTAMVYMYGHLMEQHMVRTAAWEVLRPYPLISEALIFYSKNHCFMSYALYLAGFVGFVLLLEEGKYMGQLAHLAWNHLVVFLVVCQSSFFAPNIFQGLGWFLLATMLVIANDCGAYLFGFFMGRTPLIRVSPKKTWEGFLGGALITAVFAFLFSGFLGNFKWMTCPRVDFSWGPLNCVPDPMFKFTPHQLPAALRLYFPAWAEIWWISGFQRHALALAGFASTIAPFGGFFASGVKRALGIKDFGHLIPGHGGVTDRMDCQMLMALFSYVYIQSFVVPATAL